MGWNLTDEAMHDAITATTAPPRDPEAIFGTDFWANVFSVWATDRGLKAGYYGASTLHRVWIDLVHVAPGESIWSEYVDLSVSSVVQWPWFVFDRFERVAAWMDVCY